MEPSPELIHRLRRDEIEAARKMPFAEKLIAGAELFDYACSIARDGIILQNPGFNEEQVNNELRRRISLGRRREEME